MLATALGGLGIALYAGLWLVLPSDSRFETDTPGAESATRGGRRPGRVRRLTDVGPAIALAALALGVILVVEATLGGGAVFWPIVIGLVGVALLWRQADEAQRERWLDTTGRIDPVRVVFGSGGWASYARVAAGVVLIVVALVVVGVNGSSFGEARVALVAGLLGVVGLALVVGPWVFRLASDLSAERAERVRTQERADVAAHLHDSVLQTLALIQKSSHDPATVARLARAQERDLRSWLYAGESTDERTLAGALRAAAAEVEDAHGVSVEVVTVGDCELDEPLRPIVHATREAVTNAAKHAGTGRVDVYAEVTAGAVDVFVRDRGAGFDLDDVPEDRYGVRHSILDRMERHGGTAEVRSDTRRGHRGPAAPAPTALRGELVSTRIGRSSPHRHRRRPRDVPQRRPRRAGPPAPAGRRRRRGRRRRPGGRRDRRAPARRGAARRAPARRRRRRGDAALARPGCPTPASSRCRSATPPRTSSAPSAAAPAATSPRPSPARSWSRAIRRVADGDAVFSPRLAGFVLDAFAGSIEVAAVDEDLDRLTEREREVMRLIARGYAYKEVAKELFISIKTVETHMSSVLRKLQLSSRHELTRWATDRRLL